jgi:hypothetical protein
MTEFRIVLGVVYIISGDSSGVIDSAVGIIGNLCTSPNPAPCLDKMIGRG